MARGRAVIVGGGLGTVGLLGVGAILAVATVDPPAVEIASPTIAEATFPRASHLIIGQSNTILGVGRYNTATPPGVILIGASSEIQSGAGTTNSVLLLGSAAIARSTAGALIGVTVIGQSASAITASGISGATVIGKGASYTGGQAGVIIGDTASSIGQNSTVIGSGASAITSASNTVVIGDAAQSAGARNTVIGSGTTSTGTDNVVIGQAATNAASGLRNTVVGVNASTGGFSDTIILGQSTIGFAANTLQAGSTTTPINTVLIGKGNTSSSPNSVLYRITSGVGTDIPGGVLTIQSGLGTGAGAPGALNFALGDILGTSATLQTAYNILSLANSANNSVMTGLANGNRSFRFAMSLAGTGKAVIGVANTNDPIITGAGVGDLCIRDDQGATGRIVFSTDAGTTEAASFSQAGVFTLQKDRGVRLNNQTSSAGATTGTLTNSPTVGNPTFWLKINVNGTNLAIPCWPG